MKPVNRIILFAFFATQTTVAHPPSRINLNFNSETHILKVVIAHSVQDSVKHYIDGLTIALNGKEMVRQKFVTQLDSEEQEACFLIHDAKSGDRVTITATCNVFGRKREEITLP